MKAIKINSNGYLEIERAGVFKKQICPFTHNSPNSFFGDWCLFFDGPIWQNWIGNSDGSRWGEIGIDVCNNKTITCSSDYFTDKRVKQ